MPATADSVLMPVRIESLRFDEIDDLLRESEAEGFRFVRRLVEEYRTGENRFDKSGEALFGLYHHGRLVGVCGLNRDPFLDDPPAGRVRRLYVPPSWRGKGLGRRLVEAVVGEARRHFRLLVLRTDTEAGAAFYRALGFQTEPRVPGATHHLPLTEQAEDWRACRR